MVCESGSRLLAFIVTSMVIVGCTCSNDLATPREVDPIATSALRIVHASPNASALTCRQNDRDLAGSVSVSSPVGPFQRLPSEYRNLRLIDVSGQALVSVQVFLAADREYTFVAYDRADRMRGLLLDDAVPAPEDGRVAFRVVNADVDHGSLTVLLGQQRVDVAVGQVSEWLSTSDPATVTIERGNGSPLQPGLPSSGTGSAITMIVRPLEGGSADVVVLP